MIHAAATTPVLPLISKMDELRSSGRETEHEDAPALRMRRDSSLLFKPCHAFKCSQSSLAQQHVNAAAGSGVATREKLAKVFVKSSMLAVASNRLLARVESGLVERD